ncbi:helix-turn-helix domain-containing protein [Aeromonas rivipollensis]|nr:helix-turn-helix transcriptional regulator [Aeromonas rivipollensis]MCE9957571.1 helix-turn-helix domain-containing protein [Aeromonas rivipollensis]
MKDLARIFGEKLRQKRSRMGLSQDGLALLAEIDRSYVGRIERGEVNITLEKAYQLAEVLQCDIRDLLPPEIPSSTETASRAGPGSTAGKC